MSNNHPTGERYTRDVEGMPVFAAAAPFAVYIGPEGMAGAVARDDQNCAIAQGCRTQLRTPYVSVGRFRTDIALPHSEGVTKTGFGTTKWAVIRFQNSNGARAIVIAADTDSIDRDFPEGAFVRLNSPKPSDLPSAKSEENKLRRNGPRAEPRSTRPASGAKALDELTTMGVRTLIGQRQR